MNEPPLSAGPRVHARVRGVNRAARKRPTLPQAVLEEGRQETRAGEEARRRIDPTRALPTVDSTTYCTDWSTTTTGCAVSSYLSGTWGASWRNHTVIGWSLPETSTRKAWKVPAGTVTASTPVTL